MSACLQFRALGVSRDRFSRSWNRPSQIPGFPQAAWGHNGGVAVPSPQHTRDAIVRLSHGGLGVREFSLGAARIVSRVVPFDGVCVMTMDPATQLPTGHVIENGLPE